MNSEKIKVLIIFGTRPEVIKFYPIIRNLKEDPNIDFRIVSTSQHKEMIKDLFDTFNIEVDYDLNIISKNQTLTDITKRVLSGMENILATYVPNLVLVQGDTTSAFAGALAAYYKRIPVGHVEAGLRSFNKMHPYPEEINRKLISTLSDLHFAPTYENAVNLQNEGIPKEQLFVTGNTVIDSLLWTADRNKGTLENYLPPQTLNGNRIILVTAHRRENWGQPLLDLCAGLEELSIKYENIEIVYPVHLNPNVRETVNTQINDNPRIRTIR